MNIKILYMLLSVIVVLSVCFVFGIRIANKDHAIKDTCNYESFTEEVNLDQNHSYSVDIGPENEFGMPEALIEYYKSEGAPYIFTGEVNEFASNEMLSAEGYQKAKKEIANILVPERLNEADVYDGIPSNCADPSGHLFIEKDDSDAWACIAIDGYPYHLCGSRKELICKHCGQCSWDDITYKVVPHKFDYWRFTGESSCEGGIPKYKYESFCQSCFKYCIRITTEQYCGDMEIDIHDAER